MVSSVQIVGSLLAVPLGLASGYSMYKANFAVDTTCQNLRANIVAMLDKNVDAGDAAHAGAARHRDFRASLRRLRSGRACGVQDLAGGAVARMLPRRNCAAALPATEVARKMEPKAEPKVEAKAEPQN